MFLLKCGLIFYTRSRSLGMHPTCKCWSTRQFYIRGFTARMELCATWRQLEICARCDGNWRFV